MSSPPTNIPTITTERVLEDERPGVFELPTANQGASPTPHDLTTRSPSPRDSTRGTIRNLLEVPSRSLLSRRRPNAGRRSLRRSISSYVPSSSPLRLSSSADSSMPEEDIALAVGEVGINQCNSSSDSISARDTGTCDEPDGRSALDNDGHQRVDDEPRGEKPNDVTDIKAERPLNSRQPITFSGFELGAGRHHHYSSSNYSNSSGSSTSSNFGRPLSPLSRWFISNRFGQNSTTIREDNSSSMDSSSGTDHAAQGDGRLPEDHYDSEHNVVESTEDEGSTSSGDERDSSEKSKKETQSTDSAAASGSNESAARRPDIQVATPEDERMYK